MKLKKMLKDLKRLKPNRKNYRIKWTFKVGVDNKDYVFSFLPTIIWMPWIYRMPGLDSVVEIWWLNMHITIGRFERAENKEEENIGRTMD